MKKTWNAPVVESVKIMDTALNSNSGTTVDGGIYSQKRDKNGNVISETKVADLYS